MTTNVESAEFDMQADIVVVGGGPAGMTAALGASHQGAKVAMIEKDAVTGGTAAKGAGGVWILNNRFMREQGSTIRVTTRCA